jgi:hypothetical protein
VDAADSTRRIYSGFSAGMKAQPENALARLTESAARLVGEMHVQDFQVLVSMICPKLDRVFATDVDVHKPACTVGFRVIGMTARKTLNGHEAITQKPLIFAG